MGWIPEAISNSGGYFESNLCISNLMVQKGGLQDSVSLRIWCGGECCKSAWLCVFVPGFLFVYLLVLPFWFLMSAKYAGISGSSTWQSSKRLQCLLRHHLWNSPAGLQSVIQCTSHRIPCLVLLTPVITQSMGVGFLMFWFVFYSSSLTHSIACILCKSSGSLHGTGGLSTFLLNSHSSCLQESQLLCGMWTPFASATTVAWAVSAWTWSIQRGGPVSI